ncbi:MAG TPA: helix-turn-helix transcriptional regulator [Chthoniobacteraceae bacterium]
MPAPLHLRELKSKMVLKGLSLQDVAKKASVDYSTASQILNGRRVDPERLKAITKAIEAAKMPEEVTA